MPRAPCSRKTTRTLPAYTYIVLLICAKQRAQHGMAQHGTAPHRREGHGTARQCTVLLRRAELSWPGCAFLWFYVRTYIYQVDAWYGRKRKHRTGRHSTAQDGTTQHSNALHDSARHRMAPHGASLHCWTSRAELSWVCILLTLCAYIPWYLILSYDTGNVRKTTYSTARHYTAQRRTARQRMAAHSTARHCAALPTSAELSWTELSWAGCAFCWFYVHNVHALIPGTFVWCLVRTKEKAQHSTTQHRTARQRTAAHGNARQRTALLS